MELRGDRTSPLGPPVFVLVEDRSIELPNADCGCDDVVFEELEFDAAAVPP